MALDGGGWSRTNHSHLTHGKSLSTHCTGRWVDFTANLSMCGKSCPHYSLNPEPYRLWESLYWLRSPGHEGQWSLGQVPTLFHDKVFPVLLWYTKTFTHSHVSAGNIVFRWQVITAKLYHGNQASISHTHDDFYVLFNDSRLQRHLSSLKKNKQKYRFKVMYFALTV
jgi:hypothetical protein